MLAHRQLHPQRVVLRRVADGPPRLRHAADDGGAVHHDVGLVLRPLRRRLGHRDAAHHAEQRALARAVRAQHAEHLAFPEAEADVLAGVDEAGRGPLAGPVVAAAVVLPEAWAQDGIPESLERLNDSKQVRESVREELFEVIQTNAAIVSAVAMVDAPVIDEINILQATHRAMNEALAGLEPSAEYALVDGRPVPSLTLPQTAIVKGDAQSFSIAAASILAKVTRDRLMVQYHQQFPGYGFDGHKGYGTKAHLLAIEELGACPIHRMSFAPLKKTQPELFD